MELTVREFKDNKSERYLRGAIINKWATIFETYPDITVAQHMLNVLRSKGELTGNPKIKSTTTLTPYNWSNDKTMKRLEEYEKELEQSYLGGGEYSEDYSYNRRYGKY